MHEYKDRSQMEQKERESEREYQDVVQMRQCFLLFIPFPISFMSLHRAPSSIAFSSIGCCMMPLAGGADDFSAREIQRTTNSEHIASSSGSTTTETGMIRSQPKIIITVLFVFRMAGRSF